MPDAESSLGKTRLEEAETQGARLANDKPDRAGQRIVLEEDRALLARFRAGDREALALVFRSYAADVIRLARFGFVVPSSPPARVPGVSPDAQLDVLHDVFARAFAPSARSAYDGLRPFRSWLLRITKNLRIDQCRRNGRELLTLDDNDGGGWGDVDALITAEQPLNAPQEVREDPDWTRRAEMTRQFVAQQDEQTQRYVELRFVAEHSQSESARRLGISRQQARTLEQRVQRDLKKFLKRKGML